jgi:hypothetical protein
MSLFKNLLKTAAKEATSKGGKLLKEMLDPDSDFNMKPGLFGNTNYLEKRAKSERARAEYEQAPQAV